jgi:signal recognition particle subunit SRP54
LKLLAEQVGVEWFPSGHQKPVDIARAAVDHAKRHFLMY